MTLRELLAELNELPVEALDLPVMVWDSEWGDDDLAMVTVRAYQGMAPSFDGTTVVALR